MNIVRVLICLMVATGLSSCGGGGGDSSSVSNNGTMGYFTVGETGTLSSPWGDGSSSERPAMAVKFTPILSCDYYICK